MEEILMEVLNNISNNALSIYIVINREAINTGTNTNNPTMFGERELAPHIIPLKTEARYFQKSNSIRAMNLS